MLIEEVEKRTQIHLERVTAIPAGTTRPIIAIGQSQNFRTLAATLASQLSGGSVTPEGYRIRVDASKSPATVMVAGNDLRGVLFGVGRLLRSLQFGKGSLSVSSDLRVEASPATPLRGHQLGYRPKTNSYDGWTVAMWEQYIRDLARLRRQRDRADSAALGRRRRQPALPAAADENDGRDVAHLPTSTASTSGSGIRRWTRTTPIPQTVEFALKEWGEVFRQLPRIDAVFVPGGDPGHTQPKLLMALLEKQTANLQALPSEGADVDVAAEFQREWMDEFYDILKR